MTDEHPQTEPVSQGQIQPFDDWCRQSRQFIQNVAKGVLELKQHPAFLDEAEPGRDYGEMKANIMLAYRHLEDARLRLGKAIQAYDGGTSVYDN